MMLLLRLLLLLLIVKELMTWRWPSTAETCSHRQTNNSRSYDSCLDWPTNPHNYRHDFKEVI